MKVIEMKIRTNRSGFTLVETLAVVGVVALGGVHFSKINDRVRVDSFERQSAAKLARIGQGYAMYALDNGGRIASYTWAGPDQPGDGPVVFQLPDGSIKTASDDVEAAQWQNTEILMRRTGRIDGPDRFQRFAGRIPHRRLGHIVLMDYLELPFPAKLFADPADGTLLGWQADPADISPFNAIPYAGPVPSGYASSVGWTPTGVRQRWAFSSSYTSTVSAWQPDGVGGETVFLPMEDNPHIFATQFGDVRLSPGRFYTEVFAPSAKVHLFEEFDRRQAGQPYFAYDHARPLKLMFDGAINDRASGEANPSWNPAFPQDTEGWRQRYVPLHQFPVPLSGLGETELLSQRYRWTRFGLRGIDYTP